MARKRDAIVNAAREAFLSHGYAGASMERIAAAARVSIMTVYRHAASKDDLFAAVIAGACHAETGDRPLEEWLQMPLRDVLVAAGIMFQERMADRETLALFRVVMAESAPFPHLAQLAFDGLVGVHEDQLDEFLTRHAEATGLDGVRRRRLCSAFLDHLFGVANIRMLLGLPAMTAIDRSARAGEAADMLIATLASQRPARASRRGRHDASV